MLDNLSKLCYNYLVRKIKKKGLVVIMMEKMTVAKRNEILRGLAVKALGLDKVEELLQVAGSKYAIDVELNGEYYPVRIDIVVPKIEEDDACQTAQDMHEEYMATQAEKEEKKKAQAEAKAKKIARDAKLREEKKAAKEAAKAQKEAQ